jgi:large exoprotein involved in heme utilization and adhesion
MGKGGNLTVDVNESIELIGASNLQAGAASSGNAGSLTINTGKLILLDGSGLITSTFGQGKGGDLTVIAAESVESIGISTQGQHSGFFSTAFGSGNAGNIKVETQKLVLQDGGQIVANSVGQGKSGNVNIHASEAVELIRIPPSAIFATGVFAQSLGGDDAGNLTIDTNILIVREGAFISTGAFKVNPFTGVEVENFQSQAGDLTITASESVLVSGTSGNFRSNINTITEGSGNGGTLSITTEKLKVDNGGFISTRTFGAGKGGNLTINASESIEMIGTKVDSRGFVSSSGLFTGSQGSNDAGNLTISTKKLLIQDGAQASASTFGSGRGGNVFVNASESVEIVGTSSNGEFSSSLNTRTTTVESSGLSGQGDAGNLTIDTKKLILRDGGQVSVSTLSNTGGNAGNLTINASESLEIKGFGIVSSNIISGIFAQALGEKGNGGSINISTGSLLGTDSALIQTQVGRNSEGNGGDINITANTLSLLSGANIDGSTFGRGNAGSIRLNAANSILLDGVDTDNFSSGVYSRVGSRAEGKGGSIFLNTSKIAIQNAARVVVDSQGEGEGGNINLQADSLTQNSGNISAEAASNMGGNITLQVRNLLSLENNSQISTTAGTAQASGNGGNIAIDAQFIVATPNQNNNITANAFQGRGGNINITTQGIFGIQLNQTDNLLTNDITASSDFGIDGTVSFNTPEVDPASGLVELPSTIVDADALIAKDICAFKDDKIAGGSSFVITGKGGLPPNADDPLVNSYRIVEWVTRTEEGDNTIDKPTFNNPIKTDEPANIPSIEEAQGWIINPDGKITLVAVAVNATPQSFGLVHPQCR